MVSCSGFGLPLHAQLLRLFVTTLFYKEARWLGMHKQAGTRAGNQGTHNKRQNTNTGHQRYTSHKRQSPNQAAAHASNQHTTLTSYRTLCHRGPSHRYRRDRDPHSAHTAETEALGPGEGMRPYAAAVGTFLWLLTVPPLACAPFTIASRT